MEQNNGQANVQTPPAPEKISQQMIEEMKALAFTPHAPVWIFNKELITLESGEYDVVTYPTKDGRSFQKAVFDIDGEEMPPVPYKYKEVADDARTIMIARYVAVVEDPGGVFKTPSGKIIKNDEVAYFVRNV